MTNRKRLIFDTSGINRFAEDRKSADPLIAGLISGYVARVTATNVEESIATDNPEKRSRLLEVCKELIKGEGGEIIRPFHWITEELITEFERNGAVNWGNISLRLPAYEREVALQEVIDDDVAAQERAPAANVKSTFETVFTDARPHFEELFRTGKESRPSSVADLVGRLQGAGGAFWNFGQGLYERVAKSKPDEDTIRRFIASVLHFMRCYSRSVLRNTSWQFERKTAQSLLPIETTFLWQFICRTATSLCPMIEVNRAVCER